MKTIALLIPAALMLVAPVARPVYAQPIVYVGAVVETRASGTSTIAAPGVLIRSDWSAGNALAPFVPDVVGDIAGDLIRWNGDGYTGLVVYNWLISPPRGQSMILAGRTRQGSASGPFRAVWLRAANDRGYAVRMDGAEWVESRACDLAVLVTPWPWHPADENRDGVRNASDVWTFTERYVLGLPQADFNGDGAVTAGDLFDFVAAYFGP